MNIPERIKTVKQRIIDEEMACKRPMGSVKLIAVSKGRTLAEIKEAYATGITDFGESYLQEAQTKIQALSNLPLCWHFIGPIQSNKTQGIAKYFSWVHSIAREKIAQQLNDARPDGLPKLHVCLQVNLDHEQTKSGVSQEQLMDLAKYVAKLPKLNLRGLMLIPKPIEDNHLQYLSFLRLNTLLQKLNHELNLKMDILSMGMSNDMQSAIRAGSRLVRIGTAIFGKNS